MATRKKPTLGQVSIIKARTEQACCGRCKNRPLCSFCACKDSVETQAVELYRKVRLAGADGMGKRAAARHFNNSRDTLAEVTWR